jgi:hypothetical protein
VALKDRLRRLERDAGGGMVSIPQRDGTPARFPATALQDAFLVNMQRLRGEDVGPHPLAVAAASSPDAEWSGSAFSASWVTEAVAPEDLSEP